MQVRENCSPAAVAHGARFVNCCSKRRTTEGEAGGLAMADRPLQGSTPWACPALLVLPPAAQRQSSVSNLCLNGAEVPKLGCMGLGGTPADSK